MKLRFLILPFIALPLLAACVDHSITSSKSAIELEYLKASDREIRIASKVVIERLREVEAEEDWQSIQKLSPQIYQLATALLGQNNQKLSSLIEKEDQPKPQPVRQVSAPVADLPVIMPAVSKQTPPQAELIMAALPAAKKDVSPPPFAPKLENGRSLFLALQIGSYRDRARAYAGWNELKLKAPAAFNGLRPRTERVDLGAKGVFIRLKAGPFLSDSDAQQRCQQLKDQGISCIRTDFTGSEQS